MLLGSGGGRRWHNLGLVESDKDKWERETESPLGRSDRSKRNGILRRFGKLGSEHELVETSINIAELNLYIYSIA